MYLSSICVYLWFSRYDGIYHTFLKCLTTRVVIRLNVNIALSLQSFYKLLCGNSGFIRLSIVLLCSSLDLYTHVPARCWLSLYCVPGWLASGLSSGPGAYGSRQGGGRVTASAWGPPSGAPLRPGSVLCLSSKTQPCGGRYTERLSLKSRAAVVVFPHGPLLVYNNLGNGHDDPVLLFTLEVRNDRNKYGKSICHFRKTNTHHMSHLTSTRKVLLKTQI